MCNTTYCYSTYQHEAITSHSRQLLMMGTWLPETCWAIIRREIKDTKSDIYLVFLIHYGIGFFCDHLRACNCVTHDMLLLPLIVYEISKAQLGSGLNCFFSNAKHEKVDIKYQIPSATPTATGVFLRFHMWSLSFYHVSYIKYVLQLSVCSPPL